MRNLSAKNAVNETAKVTNGHLTHPENVTYDRTTGLPKGRETYGNGVSIVVVGVTTHHGGGQSVSHHRAKGDRSFRLYEKEGMRNANS